MLKDILFALWFFLPAGLANAAPVFANKIPRLNKLAIPLDGYKRFRGKRIFGEHKTVRGLLAGIILAEATLVLQRFAFQHSSFFHSISLHLNYNSINIFYLGFLFAVGALGGDAIESFIKRQIGIAPGRAWFPFDQIDYIIGGLLLSSIVVDLPHSDYYWIGILWFIIHPISTFVAWLLGMKDSPL